MTAETDRFEGYQGEYQGFQDFLEDAVAGWRYRGTEVYPVLPRTRARRMCNQATYLDRATASRVAKELRKKEGRYFDPRRCHLCGFYHLQRGSKVKEIEVKNGSSSVRQQ